MNTASDVAKMDVSPGIIQQGKVKTLATARVALPRRASRRKWIFVALGALVLALTLGYAIFRGTRPAAKPMAFRFATNAVSRGRIQAKITATGTANPIVTVQVGSQVSGTIQALGANFNSSVQPGQMVAQIDPRLIRAGLAQAEANLLSAKAQVHNLRAQVLDARRKQQRSRELLERTLIAQQDAETSDTAVEVAAAQLEAAEAVVAQATAARDSAKLSLAFTTIVSPIHGTVISRNIDVGQTVAASFAAPTLFLIGEDLTKMEVDSNIAEADVGRLAAGMVSTFTVDAYPAEVFSGRIREVRNSPQVIQNVVTYNAVIDVANPDLKLKPGMTANLEVIYADRSDVLRVANAALRFRPPADLVGKVPPTVPLGKKLVWVLRGDVTVPVAIKPGVSDGSSTEVLDGELRPGDSVVVEAVPTKSGSQAGRIL